MLGTADNAARLLTGDQLKELQNGPPPITMLGPEASSLDILASQASLTSVKASEGPSLVVFSGGTAFNSVAGECYLLGLSFGNYSDCLTYICMPCLQPLAVGVPSQGT